MTATVITLGRAGLTQAEATGELQRLASMLDGQTPIVVIAGDLLAPQQALAPVTDDPFATTSALVVSDSHGDVVVRHHRVVSAGSSFHHVLDPSHRSVGALVIAPNDADAAREALTVLVQAMNSRAVELNGDELPEAVLVALVRGTVPVKAVELVDVPWFRGAVDDQGARELVDSVSDARIRGLLANRVDDGFYSTFVVRRASKPLTRIALRLGWSPNTITGISFAIGLAAAASFAGGSWPWLMLGALLLQLSLIVDCVDGEVARATRRFSVLGAWLDASTDRVKEFAAYAGLAIGSARMGVDIWWLAVVILIVQTTRHVTDYDFARIQRLREAAVAAGDIREPSDGRESSRGVLAGAMEASARSNRRSIVRWAKKVIHMPIGERWLLISILAVVSGPSWALGGLLIAGVLAFGYVVIGRVARTLTWSGPTPGDGAWVLRAQLDAGPIASGIARIMPATSLRLESRFGWAVPAGLRLVELTGIAVIVVLAEPKLLPVAFWALFGIAYHQYDTLYRSLQNAAPPRWLVWLGFGWDGRLLLVGALALAVALQPGLLVLAIWWALWFAGMASIQWLRSSR